MRIAMVSAQAGPLAAPGTTDTGGQSVHVAALSRALADRGDQVVVHTRAAARGLARRVDLAPGVAVDHVPAGPAAHVPTAELLPHLGAFTRGLLAAWEAERPDVVHAHFWMSGWAALAAAGELGLPVVLTYHGLETRRAAGSRQRAAVESYLARSVDRIVASSAHEAAELLGTGASRSRIAVVPCGVDLERFRPAGPVAARAPGLHRIVLVGTAESNGAGDVVSALAGVPEAELVVAGGGDVEWLRDLAARRGVAGRVRFPGPVGRDDLPALLRSADVVTCVPWYAASGRVPLEAMACGVPVVASAVGGLADTVADGHTGVLVPPRDPGRLATVLRRLLADDMVRKGYGFAAEDRARARYGWDRIAEETAAVYQRVALLEPARS